jgi:beta-galactosidase
MKPFSRRDVLKTGLLAPVAVAAVNSMAPLGAALPRSEEAEGTLPVSEAQEAAATMTAGAGRERLLLDFGWRFHFGNADDPAKDFGVGSGWTGNFSKDRKLSCGGWNCL